MSTLRTAGLGEAAVGGAGHQDVQCVVCLSSLFGVLRASFSLAFFAVVPHTWAPPATGASL